MAIAAPWTAAGLDFTETGSDGTTSGLALPGCLGGGIPHGGEGLIFDSFGVASPVVNVDFSSAGPDFTETGSDGTTSGVGVSGVLGGGLAAQDGLGLFSGGDAGGPVASLPTSLDLAFTFGAPETTSISLGDMRASMFGAEAALEAADGGSMRASMFGVEVALATDAEMRASMFGAEASLEADGGNMNASMFGVEVAMVDDRPEFYSSVPVLAPLDGAKGEPLLPLFELYKADGSVVRMALEGVVAGTTPYAPGILSFGSINREVAPQGNDYRVGELQMQADNSTGFWSQLKATDGLTGRTCRVKLGNPRNSIETFALIYTGIIAPGWRLTKQAFEFTIVDVFSNSLETPLLIPVTPDSFPLMPRSDDTGASVPILIGDHLDAPGRRLGQLPAWLIDPAFTFGLAGAASTAAEVGADMADTDLTFAIQNPGANWPDIANGQFYVLIGSEELLVYDFDEVNDLYHAERAQNATTAAAHLTGAAIQPLYRFRYVAAQGDIESVDAVYVKGGLKVENLHYRVVRETGSGLFYTADTVVYLDFIQLPTSAVAEEGGGETPDYEVTWSGKGLIEPASGLTYGNPAQQLYEFMLKHTADFRAGDPFIVGVDRDELGLNASDFDLASVQAAKDYYDILNVTTSFALTNSETTLRDVLNQYAVSVGLLITSNPEGKIRFSVRTEQALQPGFVPHLVEGAHIVRDESEYSSLDSIIGGLTYNYDQDYVLGRFYGQKVAYSGDSVSRQVGGSTTVSLYYVRDSTVAATMASAWLYFAEEKRVLLHASVDPHLHDDFDIGDIIAITESAGPASDGEGFKTRFMMVTAKGFDFSSISNSSMSIRCVDVRGFGGVGSGAAFLELADAYNAAPGDDIEGERLFDSSDYRLYQ